MLARTDSRARALPLLLVAAVVATGIGARLAWWQIVERDPLVGIAMNQLAQHELIPAERGDITDASGVLLATSVELQSVFATPPSVEDPESAAALLAPALGMHVEDLRALLASDDKWVWLKRRVDLPVSDRIRNMHLAGIGMLPNYARKIGGRLVHVDLGIVYTVKIWMASHPEVLKAQRHREFADLIAASFDRKAYPWFGEKYLSPADIDGLVLSDEVNLQFGLHIDQETFTTVGGFVLGQLGRRPRIGDTVTIEGRTMRVDALDGIRVARVRLAAPKAGSAASKGAEG